ncbi:Hypothetical predicted protein [Cloeon dipterum]|uniref:Uncharacterized protein n=1 Tax=Cloeon dipterum TaxID=197152 RepID=A0A8S1CQQ0_9INSE|nr:Hypothetical predicted protein [Cloeon dipterum]
MDLVLTCIVGFIAIVMIIITCNALLKIWTCLSVWREDQKPVNRSDTNNNDEIDINSV